MVFLSKYNNLALQIIPAKLIVQPNGVQVTTSGKAVRFVRGRYATDDRTEIAAIKNSDLYKNGFITEDDLADTKK